MLHGRTLPAARHAPVDQGVQLHDRPVRARNHVRRFGPLCAMTTGGNNPAKGRTFPAACKHWQARIHAIGSTSGVTGSSELQLPDAACMAGMSPTVGAYGKLPSQAETVFNGTDTAETLLTRIPVTDAGTRSASDLDYLTELMAIQQSDGPKSVGFFGTRNMGVTHQKLVEILSYAYATTGNHIYTSGSIGTNAAVIKGALRANVQDKLTVILPQSLRRQPAESQELLTQVTNLVEMPENDDLSLLEASRICNQKIITHVQQIICFAFHDSRLLLETCHHAKDLRKIVTLFYLD